MLFFTLPHRVTSCSLENSQRAVEEIDVCLLSCRLSMGNEKKTPTNWKDRRKKVKLHGQGDRMLPKGIRVSGQVTSAKGFACTHFIFKCLICSICLTYPKLVWNLARHLVISVRLPPILSNTCVIQGYYWDHSRDKLPVNRCHTKIHFYTCSPGHA